MTMGPMCDLGGGGHVHRLVAHEAVALVDGAVGRAQVADGKIFAPSRRIDRGVELGDVVGPIDLEVVHWLRPMRTGKTLERRPRKLLVGLVSKTRATSATGMGRA